MVRNDVRELDQLIRQYLRAGWHPALASNEAAMTFIQRRRFERAPKRLDVLKVSGRMALNRSIEA